MRTFLKILTCSWLAFWLYVGVSMFLDTPKQIEKDKIFIEREIKPAVDFIKNFKTKNGRLPNNREYYTWQREYYKDYSSDLTEQVDSLIEGFGGQQYIRKLADVVGEDKSKFKNANWTKDFAIATWRGEWMEYYFSWTDNYDGNNYSWTDGYIGLGITIGLGLLPLVFWLWNITQRKKSST